MMGEENPVYESGIGIAGSSKGCFSRQVRQS